MKSLARLSELLKTENQLITPRDFKGTEQHYASPGANEVPTVSQNIDLFHGAGYNGSIALRRSAACMCRLCGE